MTLPSVAPLEVAQEAAKSTTPAQIAASSIRIAARVLMD
jgi:hypothetical protein